MFKYKNFSNIETVRTTNAKSCRVLLLGHVELGLQRLGHSWRRGTGQSELNLDSVVDEPLESRQCSNHDDSGTETSPQSLKWQV